MVSLLLQHKCWNKSHSLGLYEPVVSEMVYSAGCEAAHFAASEELCILSATKDVASATLRREGGIQKPCEGLANDKRTPARVIQGCFLHGIELS